MNFSFIISVRFRRSHSCCVYVCMYICMCVCICIHVSFVAAHRFAVITFNVIVTMRDLRSIPSWIRWIYIYMYTHIAFQRCTYIVNLAKSKDEHFKFSWTRLDIGRTLLVWGLCIRICICICELLHSATYWQWIYFIPQFQYHTSDAFCVSSAWQRFNVSLHGTRLYNTTIIYNNISIYTRRYLRNCRDR